MKKLHLCLLLSLTVLSATAQKVYFIYIQTESEQPFFVKMNGKIQSSAASGYIILSKLVDSTYSFSIGFPQGKWAEQNFSVSVNKKDHGFLLKNFGEKGWGLFDLQTMVVQMAVAGNASADTKPEPEKNEVSAFTEILSRAADDPSLKERPFQPKKEERKAEITVQEVAKKEELKVEAKESVTPGTIEVVEAPVAKTETPKTETTISKPADVIEQTSAKKDELKTEVKEQATTKSIEVAEKPLEKKEEVRTDIKEQPTTSIEAAVTEVYKTSQVKKWAESSTTEGFGLVFIDDYDNGVKDTIRLVIPNPKPAINVIKEELKDEKKFLEISTETSKNGEEKAITPETVASGKTSLKNNCIEIATETDFFKLRKKMAAGESDDDMIAEAKRYFKEKCFSTSQLKNLGSLFLTDEGKYNFFDAAYKFVSDIDAFHSLQAELKDEYYLSRFKAMIRN